MQSRGGRRANDCAIATPFGSEMRMAAAHIGIIVADTQVEASKFPGKYIRFIHTKKSDGQIRSEIEKG